MGNMKKIGIENSICYTPGDIGTSLTLLWALIAAFSITIIIFKILSV